MSSVKHEAPFVYDADAQAALAVYHEKQIPISVFDPVEFEAFARALGFAIEKRVVFARKADLVPDRLDIDQGGPRTFSEAFYLLRKTIDGDLARRFSTYFGADERIVFR